MQFIESSISGVRAAYLRLSAGPSSAEVCLLPMIHVGAPSYFAAVKEKLDACDVVLFEGVRTFHSWLLTRSYAIATHRKRLGLVLQRDALRAASLKPHRIHSDVSTAEFTAAWRDLSSALTNHGAGARIGVLYGAAHMRAVSRLLTAKHRYRVVESQWIKVFDYE